MKVIQVGDIANVARTLTQGLREAGIDSRLLLMPKSGDTDVPEEPGIDIIRQRFRVLTHLILICRLLGRYRNSDIFHAHALYNILLMFLNKLEVSHFHGSDLLEVASGNSLYSKLLRRAMHKTKRILVSTPDLLDRVAAIGIPLEKVTFLPNPIDVNHFRPREVQSLFGENDLTIRLFHPTRFQSIKHNERLLYAFQQLQTKYPLSLYLIQHKFHSPDQQKIADIIKKLGLKRTYFIPAVSHKRLVSYYNAADIVLDQFERPIMSLVSLEALSCGKPLISAFPQDSESYPEDPPVLRGFTVEEIAESISFLVEHRDQWEDIGRKGREWVIRNHSMPVVISQLKKIYQELLD